MNLHDYLVLWRLARKRVESEQSYREFQAFQASQLVEYLEEGGICLDGKTCLDLGGGTGGYSQEFARRGARVIFLDLVQPHVASGQSLSCIRADALMIPLDRETIDFAFCASLIEHVARPQQLVAEVERVLKRGGMSYISFPPYFSPMGGHQFSPFHYLGERIALRIGRRRSPEWVREMFGAADDSRAFSDSFRGWGLYKMTLRKFRSLVNHSHLKIVNASTRYLPFSFIRWPLLGEVLTWHAQYLLVKPNRVRSDACP